jgi:hypothetical protein
MTKLKINGVKVEFFIDTGASVNILTQKDYEFLCTNSKDQISLRKNKTRIYAFGSSEPVELKGKFEVLVDSKRRVAAATFYVTKRTQGTTSILGCETSTNLRLITMNVNSVSKVSEVKSDSVTDTSSCDLDASKTKENLMKEKNTIPKAVSIESIITAAAVDPEMQSAIESIQSGVWAKHHPFYAVREEHAVTPNSLLLRATKLIIPTRLRDETMTHAHKGHQRIVKTKQALRTKVWWPRIDKDAEEFIKHCHACHVSGIVILHRLFNNTNCLPNHGIDFTWIFAVHFPRGKHFLLSLKHFLLSLNISTLEKYLKEELLNAPSLVKLPTI